MPKLSFPHPLTLLVGCILLAAALSYILPAGQYERRDDPVTGKKVVIAGTYHPVPASHVGPFQAIVAIPKGMADASLVIFFVFLVGGAFAVVDETGVLRQAAGWLVNRLQSRQALVIPIVCLAFAAGGILENMQEEIIALVPVLVLLTRRMGYTTLTAAAMSVGSAAIGAAFSPINPFQVGIAQKISELPLLSGYGFRIVFLIIALTIWILGTMRYAHRTRTEPKSAELDQATRFRGREVTILLLVLVAFTIFIIGVLRLGWDFDQMAALFFVMGVAAGLLGGMGIRGTAESFVAGFKSMAYAALLIGFARAIFVVLDQGQIVDTIVYGLVTPISHLPLFLSAGGMMVMQTLIHFPVPSVSGQAVLTMPVLIPVSDLLHLSRQTTILTYQYGAGLCEIMTPTNGALLAILAAAEVRFEDWLKFAFPLYLILFVLGAIAVAIAIAIGLH